MTIASNLYAAKVFSEHPLGLWPLDDNASYISLISSTIRGLDNWTRSSNCSVDATPAYPNQELPFPDEAYDGIICNVPAVDGEMVELISPATFQLSDLSQDLETFCINTYIYQNSIYVNWYEIGYRYYDTYLSAWQDEVIRFDAPTTKSLINFNHTFLVPEYTANPTYLIIRINLNDSGTISSDYKFAMNGLSVGQWSETTSSKNLGGSTISVPIDSGLTATGISSDQYGPLSDNGYYLEEDGKLLSKNEGVPMVFGSENVTKIYPAATEGNPSFIFPGKGFLSESGRYKTFTLEFWLRIKPNTKNQRRIFGPLDSDYGLYVSEGFLTLLIGNDFLTYNVSQWYRPMLVNLVYTSDNVLLFVNGEQIGNISINRGLLTLPDANEWMGFFSYSDIELFEIDCISIAPYPMPLQVAKRRFVYGQGVDSQESVDSSFYGKSSSIGFSNAKYSVNSVYPDKERWDAAYYNNLVASTKSLSVPAYTLPTINLGGRPAQSWYEANNKVNNLEYPDITATVVSVTPSTPAIGYAEYETSAAHNFDGGDSVTITGSDVDAYNGTFIIISTPTADTFVVENSETVSATFSSGLASRQHPKFITFRPGLNDAETTWERFGPDWTEQCYLEFSTATIASAPIASIYGIFEIDDDIEESRPLIHIISSMSGQSFDIDVSGYTVSYSFNGVELYSVDTSSKEHIVAGIHIPTIASTFGYELASFFSAYQNLKIYVGGDGTSTFEGKIYRVGFADNINYQQISNHFDANGFVNYEDDSLFQGHYSTYTLMPFYKYNRFFLDISISASWEEYIPLQYFSQYVYDSSGDLHYDLDFLQFNFGYPSIVDKIRTVIQNTGWTYEELLYQYSNPIQLSYETLDNFDITGYADYADLDNNNISEIFIDTSRSSLDAFITFQLLSEGADEPLGNFTYTRELTDNFVIDATLEDTSVDRYKAYKTKYRVVDGTIIYPPRDFSVDRVALVVHFDIKQDGILSTPLKIRDMEITSKALNSTALNPIGTRFGNDIYPYIKSGIYYDYKSKNPLTIYKKNTPYLYLTQDSGIKILSHADINKEYGASILINQEKKREMSVGAIQLFAKYDMDSFPGVPSPIFEINYAQSVIEFVVVADPSGQRGKVSARYKSTKQEAAGVSFYQNGVKVSNLYLVRGEWNVLGVEFEPAIDFSQYTGAINLFSGLTFNNVAYYLGKGLNEISSIIPKVWENVWKPDGSTIVDWEYWYDNNGVGPIRRWQDVYVLSEDRVYTLSPANIYESYVGTNIDVVDDDSGINILNDEFTIFSNTSWALPSYIQKPV